MRSGGGEQAGEWEWEWLVVCVKIAHHAEGSDEDKADGAVCIVERRPHSGLQRDGDGSARSAQASDGELCNREQQALTRSEHRNLPGERVDGEA